MKSVHNMPAESQLNALMWAETVCLYAARGMLHGQSQNSF